LGVWLSAILFMWRTRRCWSSIDHLEMPFKLKLSVATESWLKVWFWLAESWVLVMCSGLVQ
jgi:hypothetical protein